MAAQWPDTLPMPQETSLAITRGQRLTVTDVLSGPARVRVTHRFAPDSFQFEVWLTPAECEEFEEWYASAVATSHGEMYLPWIGRGRLVAFVDEYQLAPLGRGWRLSAMVVHTRTDVTLCESHLPALLRDRGPPDTDAVQDDGLSGNSVSDDFPLDTMEPC